MYNANTHTHHAICSLQRLASRKYMAWLQQHRLKHTPTTALPLIHLAFILVIFLWLSCLFPSLPVL